MLRETDSPRELRNLRGRRGGRGTAMLSVEKAARRGKNPHEYRGPYGRRATSSVVEGWKRVKVDDGARLQMLKEQGGAERLPREHYSLRCGCAGSPCRRSPNPVAFPC